VLPRKREQGLERELETAQARIAELERELEARSLRDPLTGLPTANVFEGQLEAEVERSRRHGNALSVVVFDLDGFRQVNARHGRLAGDAVLKAVGERLGQWSRTNDAACRPSADEFSVMLPETNADDAKQFAERILLELEVLQVGTVNGITASAGVAVYRRPLSAGELIVEAGDALDKAPRSCPRTTHTRTPSSPWPRP
jgi:diguanylate cyclase (GGDEF)-like protein